MSPAKRKYVAYFRVSTEKQGRSGLGLEAQREYVERFLAERGGLVVGTFTETESGKLNDRPELAAAMLRCRQTRATLLVAKLDRLSRSAALITSLQESGARFIAADQPEMNETVVGIMAVIARTERIAISERTKAALAARKARGLSLGTPRDLSAYQPRASKLGNAVKAAKADAHARDIMPMIDAAKTEGAGTLWKIAEYLNEGGATTTRGAAWTACAVQRVIRRAA
jgi:DNA invertase Pin-like site-specific DNA recombinase